MKTVQRIIPIILLITTLVACKKDKGSDTNIDVTGGWELAETSSASLPGVTMHAPGNGKMLSFQGDRYYYYDNGQVVKEGTFTIEDDNTVEQNVCLVNLTDKFTRRIVFDADHTKPKVFIYVADGMLSLISGCYAVDAGHKEVYRHLYIID
jgi:hypothetical protein